MKYQPSDCIFNPDRKHPYMGLFQIYPGWEKEMEIRGHHFGDLINLNFGGNTV